MNIQISYGEAFDRLSILEIKQTHIQDPNKLQHVQRELQAYKHLQDLYNTSKYYLFYKLLYFVNQTIWDDTNIIKQINIQDHNYAIIASKIFDYNMYRFRLKTILNNLHNDATQEQKSYVQESIVLQYENINREVFYGQLLTASLLYDHVSLSSSSTYGFDFDPTIHVSFFPNISLTHQPGINPQQYHKFNTLYTEVYVFYNQHLQHFLFPITYVAGGLLGDFIHQLSVIHEIYKQTQRRGILYLSDKHGDNFRHGNDKAYQELLPLLQLQPYIHSFQIYNNQPFQVNLSGWRQSNLLYNTHWYNIFSSLYNIPWAQSPWLSFQYPPIYSLQDKILVSHSLHRWGDINAYKIWLRSYDPSKLLFIGFQLEEYQTFLDKTQLSIPFYHCKDIFSMVHAIASCSHFIGNLSSPLTFAYALHKPCTTLLPHGCDGDRTHFRGLEAHMPFVQFIHP